MKRILFVDDDPNALQAYQRVLRRRFQIDTALGAEEALEAMRRCGPYAVVVADMRMPRITGVAFLTQLRDIAPRTVRMVLTGNADQQTEIDAVERGHVFRFLTKPCPTEALVEALEAALAEYRHA